MAELSPFLNNNPKELAFSLGQMSREQNRARYDAVELSVFEGDRLVATSGALRIPSLRNHYSVHRIYRRRDRRLRGYMTYTRFLNSFPYRVRLRMNVVWVWIGNSGQIQITLNGSSALSSRLLRKAKSRLVGKAKSPYRARTKVPRSSTLRPSPEVVNRQFLRTFESGTAGVRTALSQTVVPVLSHRREWTGSRTPNFGRLKAGQLPFNGHSVKLVECLEDKYSKYQWQPASGNWELNIYPYTEVYAPPLPPAAIHSQEAVNKAIKRLIDQMQAGIQANLAQNLAQYGQVTSMIAGTATKLVTAAKQLKRFNFLGAFNTLTAGRSIPQGFNPNKLSRTKSLASNWLELQYGWKPLLSDIEGTLQAIPTLTNVGSFVRSVRSSASALKEYSVDFPPGNALIGFSNSGKTTFLNQTKTKFVIRYRESNPGLAFAAQTGFTNPLNLTWEILPFSFVADWFLPIGPYLESLTAFQGLEFVSGGRTNFTRVRMDSAISYNGAVSGEPTVQVNYQAAYREQQIWLNRVALTEFPSLTIPSVNLRGLSGGVRAQNAIALLTQFFRNRG